MTPALPRALLALGIAALPLQASASAAQDYMLYCMGCHGPDAHGVPGKVPALAGSLSRFMRTPQGRDYVLRVPGAANSVLGDAQLAGVLNWLAARDAAAGEPAVTPFSAAEVALARHQPLSNVLATRHEVVAALAATGPAPAQEY
jgi:mono/diheme cytochrome c family protein